MASRIGWLSVVAAVALSCRKTDAPVNQAPTVEIIAPDDGAIFDAGVPISFDGLVSDAETAADQLSLVWESDLDGVLDTNPAGSNGLVSLVTANLGPGAHQIRLSATDGGDLSATSALAVTVNAVDGGPTITILTPFGEDSGRDDESYLFSAQVADAEDPPEDLLVEFESDADGVFCEPLADASGVAVCEDTLSAGTHDLTFSVADTDGNVVSATVRFQVVDALSLDDDGDGLSEDDGDCDDADPTSYPGAAEVPDGDDDDCDGDVDDGTADFDDDGDGYSDAQGDCNDAKADIHPGVTDVADGVDNDCDGRSDEGTDQFDADGDCACTSKVECADSVDATCAALATGDCDDNDPTLHPAAPEIAGDGVDQDCNTREACFTDGDGDKFGATAVVASADLDCDDLGESPLGTDCDDASALRSPASAEVPADGIDQNCDGIDGCFEDLDGDGFGTPAARTSADADCTDAGESAVSTDCDDKLVAVNPAATEVYANGRDEDCDGSESCYVDLDKDGARTASTALSTDLTCDAAAGEAGPSAAMDCNDAAASVFPGATEGTGDNVDTDCDGTEVCFSDADNDGFRTTGTLVSPDATCATADGEAAAAALVDCNDTDKAISPAATESPGDGVDSDCDGGEVCYVDGDKDGARTSATIASSNASCTSADGEGLASALSDCDDTKSAVNPGASELPGDDVDQNCDGGEVCYVDGDDDDRGATTASSLDADCNDAGEGHQSGDCNDAKASVYNGAAEVAGDDVDQSCDGAEVCYVDGDDDDYGATTTTSADADCNDAGEGHKSGDCNDAKASIYNGAPEVAGDDIDQSCDGAEVCYLDVDDDDYGATTAPSSDSDCNDKDEGHKAGDCNDAKATAYPGGTEVVDGLDNNCDGLGFHGVYAPASSTTLGNGPWEYTSLTIASGVTVTVTASAPLDVRVIGAARVDGRLDLLGKNGVNPDGQGGSANAGGAGAGGGGFAGGAGIQCCTAGNGIQGSGPGGGFGGAYGSVGGGGGGGGFGAAGTTGLPGVCGPPRCASPPNDPPGAGGSAYVSTTVASLTAGSGGGGGGGGGADNGDGGGGGGGGGALSLMAASIVIGGVIDASGGNGGSDPGTPPFDGAGGGGGSGGTLWFVTPTMTVTGQVLARGGLGGVVAPGTSNGDPGDGGNGAAGNIWIGPATPSGGGTISPALRVP